MWQNIPNYWKYLLIKNNFLPGNVNESSCWWGQHFNWTWFFYDFTENFLSALVNTERLFVFGRSLTFYLPQYLQNMKNFVWFHVKKDNVFNLFILFATSERFKLKNANFEKWFWDMIYLGTSGEIYHISKSFLKIISQNHFSKFA